MIGEGVIEWGLGLCGHRVGPRVGWGHTVGASGAVWVIMWLPGVGEGNMVGVWAVGHMVGAWDWWGS